MDDIIMAAGRKKAEDLIKSSKIVSLADLDRPIRYFRTDIYQMNDNYGGLCPKGTMVHVGAKEGAGKTTIYAQGCVSALKYLPIEEKIAFIDFEGRLNFNMIRFMCKYYGVDQSRFLYKKPISGQDGLKEIESLFQDKNVVLIMVDSLKTVVSEKAIEKDIGDNAPAMAGPKLINEFLEKHINTYPEHVSIIWIDHLKATATASSFYSSSDTKTGASVKFLSSLRVFLGKDSKGAIKKEEDGTVETIGHHVYMDVRKTTVCPMIKIKNMMMINGRGISSTVYLFNRAMQLGFVYSKDKGKDVKPGLYYLALDGTEHFIGRTKEERQTWLEAEHFGLHQEINDRVYEAGKEIFKKKMSEGYTFYSNEFSFKG